MAVDKTMMHIRRVNTRDQTPDKWMCSICNIQLSAFKYAFWGAEGAPILFSGIGFCVASCSYI